MLAIDLTRDAVVWSQPGNYQGVPAIDETSVYAVISRQVEARSRSNGDLLWTWTPPAELHAIGSVIATRNLLFVRLEPHHFSKLSGRVVALDLTLRKMVWSYEEDGEIALGNDLLLIASGSGAKVTAIAVR